jgi:hypothetical protein
MGWIKLKEKYSIHYISRVQVVWYFPEFRYFSTFFHFSSVGFPIRKKNINKSTLPSCFSPLIRP